MHRIDGTGVSIRRSSRSSLRTGQAISTARSLLVDGAVPTSNWKCFKLSRFVDLPQVDLAYHRNMNSSPLPANHSQLALLPLTSAVTAAYGLVSPVQVVLLRSWTNDVYRLTTSDATYIIKVYRASWKRPSDVEWEVQLQQWLDAHGAPVTSVIPLHDGELFGTLQAPEGIRCFALFDEARGEKPLPPFSHDLYHQYGYGTGLLHQISHGFSSSIPRHGCNLTHLLEHSLAEIQPWLQGRAEDWALVRRICTRVRERLMPLTSNLDWGVCHGDLSLDNLSFLSEGRVTFYDFDASCYGWRAWDVCNALGYASPEHHDAFLQGYREARPFGPDDYAAMPYFMAADVLRMMGGEISRRSQWFGTYRVHGWVDDKLAWLRNWDQSGPSS